MLLFRLGEDEDVVKIYYYELVEILFQHLVNERLKGGGGIDQSEGHDSILKMAISTSEGRLPFVPGGDSEGVVCVPQIQLSVDSRPADDVEQPLDQG